MATNNTPTIFRRLKQLWPSLGPVLLVPALGAWATALAHFFELGRATYFDIPESLVRVELGTIVLISTLLVILIMLVYGQFLAQTRLDGRIGRFGLAPILALTMTSMLVGAYFKSPWEFVGFATIIAGVGIISLTAVPPEPMRSKGPKTWFGFALTYVALVGLFRYIELTYVALVFAGMATQASVMFFRRWRVTEAAIAYIAQPLTKNYSNAFFFALVVVLSFPFAFGISYFAARKQNRYLIVDSQPHFVVIGIYGDKYILREFVTLGGPPSIGPRLKILQADDIAASTLFYEDIGPLAPPSPGRGTSYFP